MSELRVLLADRTYAVERPWGRLPKGQALASVSQVAVDSNGNVYVIQRTGPPVVVFDAAGDHMRSWGDGVLADPHGIFIAPSDLILVIDRDAHQVVGFDVDGRVELKIGDRHQPRWALPFNHPTDAAVNADGDVFVSDGYGNSRVHRFSPDGKHMDSWGAPGTGDGEFTTPHAIWIDSSARVIVADRENNRLQIFDEAGNYQDQWRDVYHPMDIWEDARGVTFVTDQVPRLSGFSADGNLVARCRPVLFGAHGVWGDASGNLFLAEHAPVNRITRLAPID